MNSTDKSNSITSYVVLARKWRPAQFKDIVGQQPIVRTLVNSIRSNRIHQAYLFTGPRGVGKTSIARIFAKALRCENRKDEDGFLFSCDSCFNCREITTSSHVDVIEIDGASNNGVEAVREIRENTRYMPTSGSRKIYIIDEVHMLTTAAFNALLKTLEEPPPHILFIFATTEPHKIPATILSRCQRYDYHRVMAAQIQTRLAYIIEKEQLSADTAALALIARAADGSMRDALSLLDQVIAFSAKQISVESVRESVGLIEAQLLIQILKNIYQRTPLGALKLTDSAFQKGYDQRILAKGLVECIYASILAKIGSPQPADLELSQEEWEEIQTVAQLRPLEEMEIIFQVIHHGIEAIARSPQPKIVLDILLIKCAAAESLVPSQALTPSSSPTPSTQSSTSGSASTSPATSLSPSTASAAALRTTIAPPTSTSPLSTPRPAPSEVVPSSIAAPTSEATLAPSLPQAPTFTSASKSTPAEKSEISSGPKTWEGLIDFIRKSRPLLASILEHASKFTLPDSNQVLQIFFNPQEAYFREQLQARVYQDQLAQLSKEYFGVFVRIQIELHSEGESLAAQKERVAKQRMQEIQDNARNHPIILEAKSLFGGELGPIRVKENSHDSRFST